MFHSERHTEAPFSFFPPPHSHRSREIFVFPPPLVLPCLTVAFLSPLSMPPFYHSHLRRRRGVCLSRLRPLQVHLWESSLVPWATPIFFLLNPPLSSLAVFGFFSTSRRTGGALLVLGHPGGDLLLLPLDHRLDSTLLTSRLVTPSWSRPFFPSIPVI